MENKKKRIEERIKEITKRMEELEQINQQLISKGEDAEFDIKYGIEYENLSSELVRQLDLLQEFEQNYKI